MDFQTSRRQFLKTSQALGLSLALPSAGWLSLRNSQAQAQADEVREMGADELITPAAQKAIESGLSFLTTKQIERGADKGAFGQSQYQGSVGICGLGGLAFMSEGSTPGIGRYGKHVDACCDFITRNTQTSGYIARSGASAIGNMYGHGFASLFLSQAYGMSRRKEIGDKLKAAIRLTLSAQNNQGGWRYQPVKSDADLSVTVCQIMALRAARDAGINVPDDAREKCIDYVKRSQTADGSFRYTLSGGHTTFALTGAGLVSLFSAGIYEGPEIEKGLTFLKNRRHNVEPHYYFYGHYYAVQAMWHAGGKWWNDWYPSIRDELLDKQQNDGSWPSSYSSEYGTAMACIILQMPNDRLPIFAR